MKTLARHKYILLTLLVLAILLLSWTKSNNEEPDDFLVQQLKEAQEHIPYRDSLNQAISKVNVAWHIDHSLLTINTIYKEMKASNPEDYKGSFNMGRTMMFIFNQIPRGRAESPDRVRPPDIITLNELNAQLALAKANIQRFDSLPRKSHFTHPYIGTLNRKRAKKFLVIHTKHHLSIIKDILRQGK